MGLSKFEEDLLGQISTEKMDELLKVFSHIDRLSGSPGEREAIGYLNQKLDSYGVKYTNYEFDAYLSDPIKGQLEIIAPQERQIPVKTRSFSGYFPEGIEGEVVYVPSGGDILHQSAEIAWGNSVRGKIILSEGGSPQHVARAQELGAIGLIHIWPSAEEGIHEMIASPVWGTPTPETAALLPRIPIVSTNNRYGKELMALAQQGTVRVRMKTEVRTGIKHLVLPVAEIPGQTSEYVLLCGHLDSWYVGITDNAVGNALCLEVARLLAPYAGKLKRGIKIAWWPGHSNGRYTGSTWYCDNFWQDLHDNCIAQINADSPGSKHGVYTLIRTTLLEEPRYFHDIVQELTGQNSLWEFPIRAGDLSFWGPGIPLQLMVRDEPDAEHNQAKVGGSGGGPWWHTEADTYDKADLDILLRDTRINLLTVYRLMTTDILPISLKSFAAELSKIVAAIKRDSIDEFDFAPVTEALNTLQSAAEEFSARQSALSAGAANVKLKAAAVILTTLTYSLAGEYYQDPAYPHKPLHGLQRVKNVKGGDKVALLFYKTDFIKQRNRFVNEVKQAINILQN